MSDGESERDSHSPNPPDSTRAARERRERGDSVGDIERVRERVGDASEVPETPTGYEDPYLYVRYHSRPNMFALDLVLFALGVGAFLGFGKAFADIEQLLDPRRYTLTVTVTATVLTFAIHELLHAVTAKVVGARVSFGLSMTVISTWTSHAFQSRKNTVIIALMPSVLITLAIPVIMSAGSDTLTIAALVALFVNTVGLRHDFHLVWQMFLLPRGALIYNLDDATLVYERESGATAPNPAT